MNFSLADLTRRAKNPRRASIDLRPIVPTAAMAADLYRTVYYPIIQAWTQWQQRIEAGYARALPVRDGLTRDAVDDVQAQLDQAQDWLDRLILSITPSLKAWAVKSEKWHRGKWVGAVLSATSINLATILSPYDVNDTVDAFVARNVALVQSVSEQTQHRIADIVLRGYQARTAPRDIAKEMADAVGISRKRALRIAADQNSRLSGRLDQARQEQAGIETYIWRHSYKRHPRSWHVARNGHVFEWRTGKEVGGTDIVEPGDRPREQPFCGCTSQARLSFK